MPKLNLTYLSAVRTGASEAVESIEMGVEAGKDNRIKICGTQTMLSLRLQVINTHSAADAKRRHARAKVRKDFTTALSTTSHTTLTHPSVIGGQ